MPPPKDDISQKLQSVGKFITHPSWRNNEIFLKKGVLQKIFQQLNFKDISVLFVGDSLPTGCHRNAVPKSFVNNSG